MNKFVLSTDSTCDLPRTWLANRSIAQASLSYTMDGITYGGMHEMPVEQFYAQMRAGKLPTTSQINPTEAERFFRGLLQDADTVLHLAFSSGLSGSAQSARLAAETVMESMPGKKVIVVDTLAASLGEGLVVYYAWKLREEGRTAEEAAEWLESNKLHFCHLFTVDDLNHLHRGGRVSKTAAVVGTMLNVKPILHVDDEGHLIPIGKVRGRTKSLDDLVRRMGEHLGDYQNEIVFISHGDCLADAEYVRDRVREKFGVQEFLIHAIGPTIGAHSGPGTVALFFLGDHR